VKRGCIALACALTLAVALLTPSSASADSAAEAPASPQRETLPVRPQKPLQLAQESSGSSAAWKLVLAAIVAGGAIWLFRRRKASAAGASAGPAVRIVTRTPIGIRSELVVVDVDGATLLLGVTPHTIQMVTTIADAGVRDIARARDADAARELGAARGYDDGAVELLEPRPTGDHAVVTSLRPKAPSVRAERQILGLIRRTGADKGSR
jgi:flagellar protein FliO/FliZ